MANISEKLSFSQAVRTARQDIATGVMTSSGHESWFVYDSPIESYEKTFARLLHGKGIADLVADKPEPVVIDLMASSTALADLFQQLPHAKKHGISLSLSDLRSEPETARDNVLGITHLEGDLSSRTAWQKLEKTLAGRKANVILVRPFMGMDSLPEHQLFYRYALQQAWKMLDPDGGTLLMETPSNRILKTVGLSLDGWTAALRKKGIAAESKSVSGLPFAMTENYGIAKVVRNPHAPSELPFKSITKFDRFVRPVLAPFTRVLSRMK